MAFLYDDSTKSLCSSFLQGVYKGICIKQTEQKPASVSNTSFAGFPVSL